VAVMCCLSRLRRYGGSGDGRGEVRFFSGQGRRLVVNDEPLSSMLSYRRRIVLYGVVYFDMYFFFLRSPDRAARKSSGRGNVSRRPYKRFFLVAPPLYPSRRCRNRRCPETIVHVTANPSSLRY